MPSQQKQVRFRVGDHIVTLLISIEPAPQELVQVPQLPSPQGRSAPGARNLRTGDGLMLVDPRMSPALQEKVLLQNALILASMRLMGTQYKPAHGDAMTAWFSRSGGKLTREMIVYAYEETAINTSGDKLIYLRTILERCVKNPTDFWKWNKENTEGFDIEKYRSGKYAFLFNPNGELDVEAPIRTTTTLEIRSTTRTRIARDDVDDETGEILSINELADQPEDFDEDLEEDFTRLSPDPSSQ